MNILLISQCNKNALLDTRRVLDQFAERKGDRTWQTAITQQGLVTLRKMLKKTARRNTAVACHRIGGKNFSELLFIVGNAAKFNEDGTVPTNTTERDILRTQDENNWHTAEAISLLAGIAGLFHDFGKANRLFQKKLAAAQMISEPYRHEWVSLRLFQAFVDGRPDQEWLNRLATVTPKHEKAMLEQLEGVKDLPGKSSNPFRRLPDLARIVSWLIVSHHKLPKYQETQNSSIPQVSNIDRWLTGKMFGASWNSPQCTQEWSAKDFADVWLFDHGTPMRSQSWCLKARSLASRAQKHTKMTQHDWLDDRFSSHMARLSLMLADHCYSAGAAQQKWQDSTYKAYANTDRKTRELKQKLDEHNIGVGHNAFLFAKSLPKLRDSLPSITRHKGFKQRSKNPKFRWQDKAYDVATGIKSHAARQGFFGVNMASTGCGKTFANARIMYGLADEKLGCRFNVALGLRTLTLQTGDALQERLQLESDDLAVLIGSQAVRELHESNKSERVAEQGPPKDLTALQTGSESSASLLDEHQYVRYDGSLDDGRLSHWLEQSPKLHQLLSAPVLVSTIDHLIPATEGERGGKQIAPMLRLLTSDLVLDEPDDFGLEDTPALARLVNWAGMLGARVLLSSATLPPALLEALFDAYLAGRKVYMAARGEPGTEQSVCCAWFDEFATAQSNHDDLEGFARAHASFVDARLTKLRQQHPLRLAELVSVQANEPSSTAAVTACADTIEQAVYRLHKAHGQSHAATGKKLSIGLVRMANINPMVAVAQELLSRRAEANYRIHFCIYHSQHPLLTRSTIESALDRALDRRDPEALWEVPVIRQALTENDEANQLFIVFATAVAEVGRDHDYDWAVVEPSSMRSIIQLAGRIQRHRQLQPKVPNLLLMNQNFKALRGAEIAYTRPGFESKDFPLVSKKLDDILLPEQYQTISATPRIQPRSQLQPKENLVDLEHAHMQQKLFGGAVITMHASLWWRHNASWCAELQRQTPFRKSTADEEFLLYMEEEGDEPLFHRLSETGVPLAAEKECFLRVNQPFGERVQPWLEVDFAEQIVQQTENQSISVHEACVKFARLSLRKDRDEDMPQVWNYHPQLGAYRPVG